MAFYDFSLGTGDIYIDVDWKAVERVRSAKFNQWDSNLRRAINLLIEVIVRSSSQSNRIVPIDSKMFDIIILEDDDFAVNLFTDRTSALRFNTVDPIVPDGWSFEDGDKIYFGHNSPFTGLDFNFSTVSSGTLTLKVEYYKTHGTVVGWTKIVVTDGTSGFTVNGKITWDANVVTDWGFISLNEAVLIGLSQVGLDPKPRFLIRVEIVSGMGGTPPELNYIWLAEQPLPLIASQEFSTNDNGVLEGTRFVRVLPGKAIINGELIELKEPIVFFVPTLGGSLDRFGAIVIEFGKFLTLITGNADCSPFEALSTGFQYKLADVKIAPGNVKITDTSITNQRV